MNLENLPLQVQLRLIPHTIKEYVSQIQSFRNIEIRAQKKAIWKKSMLIEGQHVRAGQVLFRIMPKLYEAEYLKAQAETKAAELENDEYENARRQKDCLRRSTEYLAHSKTGRRKGQISHLQNIPPS
jgi:membrane fusion protein (multidrug efflux system)